jgi:ABC-2 type transport system ATP-binding protein
LCTWFFCGKKNLRDSFREKIQRQHHITNVQIEALIVASVQVSHASKSFGSVKAVDDVSFEVNKGEIFGLLGPNGAGKTTAIRIILNLIKPDSGDISILGGKLTESRKNRIGYMPEERGLYQELTLERVLLYLAALKGMPSAVARKRMIDYLERFELLDYRKKKVKQLSKGMQQKAQIIATLLHEPELIIVWCKN